jgi:hypothetical protein
MKKILATLAFLLLAAPVFSQSFQRGQIDIFAGLGIPPLSRSFGSISRKVTIYVPPVAVGAEYAFSNRFSIGILAGFQKIKTVFKGFSNIDSSQNTTLAIGVRGAYHFAKKGKIDAYAGLSVFYYTTTGKTNEEPYNNNSFLPGIFTGIRYRFTQQFAAFAELGISYPVLSAGIDMRF